MKRYINTTDNIFGMSNVRGKYITVEHNVPFSFYYSPQNSSHGPRVKVTFNPDRFSLNSTGVQKLCGDWKFIPGKYDSHVSKSEIERMQSFFHKYLILFLLAWDNQVDDPDVGDYLQGRVELHELISHIDFYDTYKHELDAITTVQQLEDFCRHNNLVNMYGN